MQLPAWACKPFRARLVIVFKNCCLKRCENCGLKNVVKKRIFSVNKTKKCVWYVCFE